MTTLNDEFIDVLINQPIAAGGHNVGDNEACVMEKVAILWALHAGLDMEATFDDAPRCTNAVIASFARHVNDGVGDEARQKLNALIPRLLRARRIPKKDRRIAIRMLLWAVRYIDVAEGGGCTHCRCDCVITSEVLEAMEKWINAPSKATRAVVNSAARSNGHGVDTTAISNMLDVFHNPSMRTMAESSAMEYIDSALHDLESDLAKVQFLSDALDAWEEFVSKEGEDIYVPRPWEDAALSFFVKTEAAS